MRRGFLGVGLLSLSFLLFAPPALGGGSPRFESQASNHMGYEHTIRLSEVIRQNRNREGTGWREGASSELKAVFDTLSETQQRALERAADPSLSEGARKAAAREIHARVWEVAQEKNLVSFEQSSRRLLTERLETELQRNRESIRELRASAEGLETALRTASKTRDERSRLFTELNNYNDAATSPVAASISRGVREGDINAAMFAPLADVLRDAQAKGKPVAENVSVVLDSILASTKPEEIVSQLNWLKSNLATPDHAVMMKGLRNLAEPFVVEMVAKLGAKAKELGVTSELPKTLAELKELVRGKMEQKDFERFMEELTKGDPAKRFAEALAKLVKDKKVTIGDLEQFFKAKPPCLPKVLLQAFAVAGAGYLTLAGVPKAKAESVALAANTATTDPSYGFVAQPGHGTGASTSGSSTRTETRE